MLERWVFDVIVERLGSRLVHNLVSRMDFMEARLKTVRRTVYLVCTYVRRIASFPCCRPLKAFHPAEPRSTEAGGDWGYARCVASKA